MAPQPIGSNAQKQRLTTALKNICRDYPAGGTVIRELLQNADDAGATEVKFVLDDRTYPKEDLIHPSLAQYQGPALLSFNNAVFKDKDFQSLSQLGDSLKLNDGATTGRFGRGFNSVYNWTDSPSIVSRERLLILDPHQEWSEGGPVYDFVKDFEDTAIKNQMVAYQSVMQHLDRPLDGTVIRIPLRNRSQTLRSDISSLSTTPMEIQEILRSFSAEFGTNGLLFMRNVTKLAIKCAGMSLKIEMIADDDIKSHKAKIIDAVKSALKSPDYSFHYNFKAGIRYTSEGESTTTNFMIQHSILDSLSGSLRAWAIGQQFIPWVAVAAQLPVSSSNITQCSLFNVLPLPVRTVQPLHIHALFSLTPDRANLHRLHDQSAQYQEPAKWNEWLFKEASPMAWTKLLVAVAKLYPLKSAFDKWPKILENKQEPLSDAVDRIVAIIQQGQLALWPTEIGYVSAEIGFLSLGSTSETVTLKEALGEAYFPVVYVPKSLQGHAKKTFNARVLSPESICTFLNTKPTLVSALSDKAKIALLEYVLSSTGLVDCGNLEIFPFEDGKFRSIQGINAFVHRDDFEKALFTRQGGRNLAHGILSKSAQNSLLSRCGSSTLHSSIRFRSVESLKDYCNKNVFKNFRQDQAMYPLNTGTAAFVANVWTWITDRNISMKDEHLSYLWLLPTSDDQLRQVKCQATAIYVAPPGLAGDVMRRIDALLSVKSLPLLLTGKEALGHRPSAVVKNILLAKATLGLADASSLLVYLQWLRKTLPLITTSEPEERDNIAQTIAARLSNKMTSQDMSIMTECLRGLRIFRKVTWESDGDTMVSCSTWTSLNNRNTSFGLLDEDTRFPDIRGVQFLAAPMGSPRQQILCAWKLARCVQSADVIQDQIIPAWQNGLSDDWSSACKEDIAAYILGAFSSLSLQTQAALRELPIVPVMRLNGDATTGFACASELIDSDVKELTALCFEDEAIVPKERFSRDFNVALKGCGLKTMVDETVVRHRIKCYASGNYSHTEVEKRARMLLRSSCKWESVEEPQNSDLRVSAWLPATQGGVTSLKNSSQCRGIRDGLLVGSQFPILITSTSEEWEHRLGWNVAIDTSVLMAQLQNGISHNSRLIVDAVLSYVSTQNLIGVLAPQLKDIRCVVIRSDFFVVPDHAFRPTEQFHHQGCYRLHPYLANVDSLFWHDHEKLLIQIGVRETPEPADLLKVQGTLIAKDELHDHDVVVAIEILKFAAKFPREAIPGLKVLGATGNFHDIGEIYYNDLGALRSRQGFNLTHPDIPLATIRGLGIDSLSAQRVKGILEIGNEDEEEFDQQENAITRISDTLDRYPIDTTFREYLANADDSKGATEISWLLDERNHPSADLITPEMKELQGPSLLTYNNGTFTKADFDGLKNVGEGSKMLDKGSIGQFGRGSQTMFHFTDFPLILSGEYLLILDPQRSILPMNPIKGKRMPGVKLKLTKVREACPDQLAPFEGLFGYSIDQDSFSGTIFRFPLVTQASKGLLRISKRDLNSAEVCRLMDAYFEEARSSLLFLRHIDTIEFSVHGKENSGWLVERRDPVLRRLGQDTRLSQQVNCPFTKHLGFGKPIKGEDMWWVSIQDLSSIMELHPATSKRAAKNVECGIAALLSSDVKGDHVGILRPARESQMFNTLPLTIASDLPVHIHASFSLSGDRKSIALDAHRSGSPGSESNRHLLENIIPKLYLEFLSDLVVQIHTEVFKFWPQEEPAKNSFGSHIYTSFWQALPGSLLKLFPNPDSAKKVEVYDLAQAVFDFTIANQSKELSPLLLSLGVNLVRDIPKHIVTQLKKLDPSPNYVSGAMLRALLKAEGCKPKLQVAMKSSTLLWGIVFDLMAPPNLSVQDAQDCHGCHVLPLANQSLGTLKIAATDYYMATFEEVKLFQFASEKLVLRTAGPRLEALITKGKFNVVPLQLIHFGKLLESRPAPLQTSIEADQWLESFWKYWNSKSVGTPNAEVMKFNSPLLRATYDHIPRYFTPQQFYQLPAVVLSSLQAHQQLCESIPGLYHVSQKYLPKTLAQEEKSLDYPFSFCRLIRSLAILAGARGNNRLLGSRVDDSNIQTLRNLVIEHVSGSILQREHQFPGLKQHIQNLPIWPSFTKTPTPPLIAASSAIIASNSTMLVPWVKSSSFIDPKFMNNPDSLKNVACLAQLGVCTLTVEALLKNHVLPLPQNVGNVYWAEYKVLINTLASFRLPAYDTLRTGPVAIDGNMNLKIASQLFDHENATFKAAFVLEDKTHFLHPEIRRFRAFWLKCGLRHDVQNLIEPSHYLDCILAMANRTKGDRTQDPTFNRDMQVVLAPLTALNHSLGKFTPTDWQFVANQNVFQSRTVFDGESEYQRHSMTIVSQGKPSQTLSELISKEYTPICWSQVPFAIHEPSPYVFNQLPDKGKPQARLVWRHLKNLKDVSLRLKPTQVQDFFRDLKKTYQHLQDHVDESRANFDLADNKVWLNMREWNDHTVLMEDFQTSWQSIDMLVLSSSVDSGSVQAVRPGLMVYEKLLRALGCKSIIYPTIEAPPLPEGYSLVASLRQLRKDGKLLDITYSSEGRTIEAHTVVLASVSEYCKAQFANWTAPPIISYDRAVDPDFFLTYRTVKLLIDYAYEEPISWENMQVVEADDDAKISLKRDMLLDLCKGADYWMIESLLAQAEARLLAAGGRMINLDNVYDVERVAKKSGAVHFQKLCEKFINENHDAVVRAHSQESG
ncbi:hypothetical protein VTL71DRAFT_1992 [Oculimacula yallundae]|uniref:BTB domain-containing protein n=1 Tax=Oculimacula yallundae TaxID=86028 RepID=A0ABR4CCB3_9HELO